MNNCELNLWCDYHYIYLLTLHVGYYNVTTNVKLDEYSPFDIRQIGPLQV